MAASGIGDLILSCKPDWLPVYDLGRTGVSSQAGVLLADTS